jgi:two-component system, NtrC family, sensor kinase
MNAELYQLPTLGLLAALVIVFGWLWLQGRSDPALTQPIGQAPPPRQRHLLWLAGWWLAVIELWLSIFGRSTAGGAGRVCAMLCMVLAPLMFLASLAPQYLFIRRLRILCVLAFGAPLVVIAALVALYPNPGPLAQLVLLVCAVAALGVGAIWSLQRGLLPTWGALAVVGAFGCACLWEMAGNDYMGAVNLARGGMLAMAALLFACAFRRLTAGVFLTVGGLAVWALQGILQVYRHDARLLFSLTSLTDLLRMLTAVGMVVLVMEDEIAANRATHARDQQAQREMQRYAELYMEAMPYEPSAGEYDATCRAITEMSRFSQAAVLLRNAGGSFRLAGQSGFSREEAVALDGAARQITHETEQEISRPENMSRETGDLMIVDLTLLIRDEPVLQAFRKARVLGIRVREGAWQGVLLLGAPRNAEEPLQTQDVMPLELLVARIGATREHALLLRRLMQSDRLAGLGQLASSVAHELNNPLTAVTGFAELLAESQHPDVEERAGIILNEARRMKKIIESLVRFRRLTPAGRWPVSVGLLLRDIEKLARHDLESARVELELRIANDLPRAMGDGEQIRQVFLQLVKNASIALEELPEGEQRRLIVEVEKSSNWIRATFTDNGPGFSDPSRAFDPFLTTRHTGEGVGLGLSLCYSIVHEQGGEITAENVQPRGARVIVDLPLEEATHSGRERGETGDDMLAPAM